MTEMSLKGYVEKLIHEVKTNVFWQGKNGSVKHLRILQEGVDSSSH